MRTKLVLMAMALPALFAACTSDEFVEPAQGDLNGRALLNGLTVNVDQDAETRFAWGNYKWSFEAGDQFGAALTDPTATEVQDGQLLGNYIFSKGNNGYTTTSQMYEGIYFFYSYPGFQGKATRDLVKFDLGVQKADLTKPEEVISNTQLFFSPLYDIKAETVDAKLPLKFYPYWSVAAFKIKNNTGKAFNISQIVLKGSFQTKGEISPVKIEKAKLVYSIADGDTEYSLPEDVKLDDLMAGTDFAKETGDGYTQPTAATSIALSCGNYELANGKEVIAYMSVPAGAQSDLKAEIMVNAEGVSKKIVVEETKTVNNDKTESIASNGIGTLKFLRGGTKAVFGFETDGKTMKALNVAAKNLQDANGYFVDNKTDLLAVINANRGGIEVFNMGDLAIDNEIAKALTLYTAAGVKFANPIEVKAEGDVTIDKTEFAGGVTVKSGNVTFGENVILSANAKMDVAGGKVILKGEGYKETNSSIEVNNGELVLSEKDMQIAKIEMNNGTLTLNGESQTIGSGKIENIMFNVAAGKKVNLNVALYDAQGKGGTLTIDDNGTLGSNVTTTVSKGNKVSIATGKSLTNEGAVVNNGEVAGDGTLVNKGTISNAGTVKNVDNTGFIINTDGWYSVVEENKSDATVGYIDNTVGGKVTAKGSNKSKVYRVYSDITVTEKSDIQGETEEIAILKNVKFANKEAVEITPDVIMLGTTEFQGIGGVTITNAVIGVNDDNKVLAAKVLEKAWTETNTVAKYNESVEVRVYENVTLTVNGTYKAADKVTLLNKGTVVLTNGEAGDLTGWEPTNAVASI